MHCKWRVQYMIRLWYLLLKVNYPLTKRYNTFSDLAKHTFFSELPVVSSTRRSDQTIRHECTKCSFCTILDLTCALIGQSAPRSSVLTRDFRTVILASVIKEIASVTRVRQPRASQPVGGRWRRACIVYSRQLSACNCDSWNKTVE